MVREFTAELIDAAGAEVGEGPVWDAADDSLVWVDITAGLVHRTAADGARKSTMDIGCHVGAALPAEAGGWLLATREGFATLDPAGRVTPLLQVYADRPEIRFNDAKCDPAGRAYAGSMPYDSAAHPGTAHLLRLDPGPTATTILDGVTVGNGLGWSPDGRTMYFIDSATQSVAAFDYDPQLGTPTNRRTLLEIPAATGMPDGMCVDDDGCLWIGLWGGGAVHRYTPAGDLDTVIQLPATQVTSCAFGGPRGDTLYITTAAYRLDEAQLAAQPYAGGLFAAVPGATAAAATPWQLAG